MKTIRHNEYDKYSCVSIHDTSLDCLIDQWATNNVRDEKYDRDYSNNFLKGAREENGGLGQKLSKLVNNVLGGEGIGRKWTR